MASRRQNSPRRRPPSSPEENERRLVNLAHDLAAKQLEDGSATAQVITHYLKLGSVREELEREKLRRENMLLAARVEQIQSAARMEELYDKAISAMRSYTGAEDEEVSDDY